MRSCGSWARDTRTNSQDLRPGGVHGLRTRTRHPRNYRACVLSCPSVLAGEKIQGARDTAKELWINVPDRAAREAVVAHVRTKASTDHGACIASLRTGTAPLSEKH